MNQRERLLYALILLLAGAALCYGWKLYWFLTDDAYISFRYVSNWDLGHGLVWNPPPFRPVEGYTNFLWIVLLYGVWQVLDVAPPAAANYLALCFALCSLYITAQMLLRLPWSPRLRPYRLVFLALLLLAVTTNRTFLAWSSSGLETALFGCTVLAWTWACAFVAPSHRRVALSYFRCRRRYLSDAPGWPAFPRCHCGRALLGLAHWLLSGSTVRPGPGPCWPRRCT